MRQCAKYMYVSPYRTKAPKYARPPTQLFVFILFYFSFEGTQPTPLTSPSNLTPEQAILEKNHDDNARRADRDPHGIFRTPTDAFAPPAASLVGPSGLRLTVIFATDGQACAGARRCGEPRNLGHEPWCGTWETADSVEDVGWLRWWLVVVRARLGIRKRFRMQVVVWRIGNRKTVSECWSAYHWQWCPLPRLTAPF